MHPAHHLIAHHEAGHAVVGHRQGLTFSVIYVGDVSGQVIFDEQWEREAVVNSADLLDRYGLMLLAGGHAELRYFGSVSGAEQDAETLEQMFRQARTRGTLPRQGLWRRAQQQVADNWPAIAALANELEHHGASVDNPDEVLGLYPHLGLTVAATSGARVREIINADHASVGGTT